MHAVHAISIGGLQNRLPIEIACTACTACTRPWKPPLDTFGRLIFGHFLRTVSRNASKRPTKMASKVNHMLNTLADLAPTPLSSLLSLRSLSVHIRCPPDAGGVYSPGVNKHLSHPATFSFSLHRQSGERYERGEKHLALRSAQGTPCD